VKRDGVGRGGRWRASYRSRGERGGGGRAGLARGWKQGVED